MSDQRVGEISPLKISPSSSVTLPPAPEAGEFSFILVDEKSNVIQPEEKQNSDTSSDTTFSSDSELASEAPVSDPLVANMIANDVTSSMKSTEILHGDHPNMYTPVKCSTDVEICSSESLPPEEEQTNSDNAGESFKPKISLLAAWCDYLWRFPRAISKALQTHSKDIILLVAGIVSLVFFVTFCYIINNVHVSVI